MEAGRELDALVAEKVMGWSAHDIYEFEEMGGEQGYTNTGIVSPDVPHYSIDIAAAWELVDWLGEQGHDVRVGTGKKGRYCEIDLGNIFVEVESAAHAICLATLKAVGIEVK